jgi:hypothetical protein
MTNGGTNYELRMTNGPFETVMLSGRPKAWSGQASKRNTPAHARASLRTEACEAIVYHLQSWSFMADLLRMLSHEVWRSCVMGGPSPLTGVNPRAAQDDGFKKYGSFAPHVKIQSIRHS